MNTTNQTLVPRAGVHTFRRRWITASNTLWMLGAAAFILAAGFFYLGGLSGALISYPDENRAFHFQILSPLLYLVSHPLTVSLGSFDAPFYVLGVAGILNTFMVFGVARAFFNKTIAAYASLFYLFYDFPLIYARQLYYSTLVTFFVLAALAFFALALRFRKSAFLILAGGALSGALFSNPSSYAVVAGAFGFFLYRGRRTPRTPYGFSIPNLLLSLIGGVVICLVLFEAFLYWKYRFHANYQSFVMSQFFYQKLASHGASAVGWNGIRAFLGTWTEPFVTRDFSNALRNTVIFSVIAGSLWRMGLRREPQLVYFWGWAAGSFLLFSVSAYLGIHELRLRHLVWTSFFVSLSFGVIMHQVMQSRRRILRGVMAIALVAYFGFAGQRAWAIRNSMTSAHAIEGFLKQNGIKKDQILTLFPINRYRDYTTGRLTQGVPVVPTDRPEDLERGIHQLIVWPLVYEAYRRGWVRYYLSSGIGDIADVGIHDPIIQKSKPLITWPHPMNNRYIHTDPAHYTLALYDLKDLFAKKP